MVATKKASPVLSPEDMVSCDKGDMGCSGGQLPNAWKYLKSTGIVSDTCFPKQVCRCGDMESIQGQSQHRLRNQWGDEHAKGYHDERAHPGRVQGVQKFHVIQNRRVPEALVRGPSRRRPRCQNCRLGYRQWR